MDGCKNAQPRFSLEPGKIYGQTIWNGDITSMYRQKRATSWKFRWDKTPQVAGHLGLAPLRKQCLWDWKYVAWLGKLTGTQGGTHRFLCTVTGTSPCSHGFLSSNLGVSSKSHPPMCTWDCHMGTWPSEFRCALLGMIFSQRFETSEADYETRMNLVGGFNMF